MITTPSRWPGGGEALRRKARLLAWLTPRLPGAALPEVLRLGAASPLAPEGFSVARRVPGRSALGATLPDPVALGGALGRWLADLHDLIRTPIEWAAKPVQSERMREGEKRVPDVEPAIR